MAFRQYTREQLLRIRDSPLIQKPDNLPAIEQWIDESQQSQQQHRQVGNGAGRPSQRGTTTVPESSPMGNFSTGQRPSLMRGSVTGSREDITLGPPKTLFASSLNTSRLSDFADKPGTPPTESALEEREGKSGGRAFGDRQINRKSLGPTETDSRHTRESWTSGRDRRANFGDEEKPDGERRFGRRDRDQDSERRNGYSDRPDNRWHRDDRRANGERQGGWRERESERRDRDYDRGRADKEPEWMEEPSASNLEEDSRDTVDMPRNQEEFEKWKQAQHNQNKRSRDEREAVLPETQPAPPAQDVPPVKMGAPLKLEGIIDKPFGSWSEGKGSDSAGGGAPTSTKSSGKSKTSRFMPMFKKDEVKEEPAVSEPSVQTPATVNGSAEDKAGFENILRMLGNTAVSQQPTPIEPASPPPRQVSNGTKPKSRFTGFFDQTKSPERLQSPPSNGLAQSKPADSETLPTTRGILDQPNNLFGGRLGEQPQLDQRAAIGPSVSTISPDPLLPFSAPREQRPQSLRMSDVFLDPTVRGASSPDTNIQDLLASQRTQQRQSGVDNKNSEFLLGLLQNKGTSRPQQQQPRQAPPDFQLWREQPPNVPETHAPKPRAPPYPGLFEDQLLRNHPQEPLPRQEQLPMAQSDLNSRRAGQRAPLGYYDEQLPFQQQPLQQQPLQPQTIQQQAIQQQPAQQQPLQQQGLQHQPLQQQGLPHQHHQRNFPEPQRHYAQPPPNRRMSGHPNLPPMQIPPHHQPQPPYHPEFLQSPAAAAPPPGFNPHMPRHPPGMHNIPNIFSTPQPPPQQQQQPPPPRDTSTFGGVNSGMMSQQPQQTMASVPNAPPGFFSGPPPLPPGYMQLRSPQEGLPAGGGRGFDGYRSMGPGR